MVKLLYLAELWGNMTLLLLVRHGENDYVKQNKLAGWTPGVHLNDKGREQAQTLVERLAGVKIDAIYASPLERAVETAQPLAQARGLPVVLRDRVGEVHYGDWTGGLLPELAKTEMWMGVQVFPSRTRFPGGGESIHEAQTRAVAELERIACDHADGTVVVVAHSDIIKAALAHYMGAHLDVFQRLEISPASVSAVYLGRFNVRVLRMNDDGPMKTLEEKPAEKDVKSETEKAVPAEGQSAAANAGDA